MGKKTNWTISEDQALCRAWLCASDASLGHSSDQKAGTFWGVVHQLFHAELETSVDRPVTGLKIRWTRINRDVQRFALTFARVQAVHAAARAAPAAGASTESGERETPEIELEHERLCIEEATELFAKEQGSKFTFESCWKMLRFSPRWMQLLANSAGVSASALQASPSLLTMDRLESAALGAANGAAAAVALQKRRLASFMETHTRALPDSATGLLATIAQELARQSDLMEEQNAIALFRLELDLVEDDDAREYFSSLRQTYAKRMRREGGSPVHASIDTTAAETDKDSGVAVTIRDNKETADL